jgi:hypothetical protein
MEENIYDEKKFSEVIKLLQELPRIETAENFEFNLITRIKNGNFELNTKEKKINGFVILAPSFTVVAVAVLVFLFYPTTEYEIENLLISEPEMRTEQVADGSENREEFEIPVAAGLNNSPEMSRSANIDSRNKYRVLVKSNDVVIKERIPYPFNNDASLDLDNVIATKPALQPQLQQGELTSLSRKNFDFKGFFIRGNDKSLPALKARLDSVNYR